MCMKSFISYKKQEGEYRCHLCTDEAAEAGEVGLPRPVGGAGGCIGPGHESGAFSVFLYPFLFSSFPTMSMLFFNQEVLKKNLFLVSVKKTKDSMAYSRFEARVGTFGGPALGWRARRFSSLDSCPFPRAPARGRCSHRSRSRSWTVVATWGSVYQLLLPFT